MIWILNQLKSYHELPRTARHHIVIEIHIQYKFHEIPFSGNLVMAPDGRTERQTDGGTDGHGQTYIPRRNPPAISGGYFIFFFWGGGEGGWGRGW